jgi:methionyl-tRNA formyltransferase
MKILLYGSTFLSEQVEALLLQHHEIVGHIPSKAPIFTGRGMRSLPVQEGDFYPKYDVALSVQYDRKVTNLDRAYNLHTGLLPDWGGCDILYHTLEARCFEQGLTFHKMTEKFDEGGIVSKVIYPVYFGDTILDLYQRVAALAPGFALASLELLYELDESQLRSQPPRAFKRGKVDDLVAYAEAATRIKEWIKQETS